MTGSDGKTVAKYVAAALAAGLRRGEQIAAWLAQGLRLMKIHRRLRAQGLTVPYLPTRNSEEPVSWFIRATH